jgi:hypothetical protein
MVVMLLILQSEVMMILTLPNSTLHELRRKTRHRIRVVTRNSLGLAVNLGLSSVAPQMLIAAAINGFCLGIGGYKLHQHLRFLA